MPTLYEASIPVFLRALRQLSHVLKQGEAFASEKSIAASELEGARLIDDMGNLPYQIQRVSDTAKLSGVRLAGIESVPMADNEKTFEEMQARIQKTVNFLENITPESVNGNGDEAIIHVKAGGSEYDTTKKRYLLEYAIPNFFFHVVTAYDILRSKGVPVGKKDYLGDLRPKT